MIDHELTRATVARVHGDQVTLQFAELATDVQTLTVPQRLLPSGVKAGDTVVVEFLPDEIAAAQRDATARKLLEDILNGK